jgi:hypothetical protein
LGDAPQIGISLNIFVLFVFFVDEMIFPGSSLRKHKTPSIPLTPTLKGEKKYGIKTKRKPIKISTIAFGMKYGYTINAKPHISGTIIFCFFP